MLLADPPEHDPHGDPIPFDPEGGRPQFPVFILGAPGVLGLLALAMTRAMAQALRSPAAVWTTTIIASIGAVACFWIIAARSREASVRIPATIALVGAIALSVRAVLTMI